MHLIAGTVRGFQAMGWVTVCEGNDVEIETFEQAERAELCIRKK